MVWKSHSMGYGRKIQRTTRENNTYYVKQNSTNGLSVPIVIKSPLLLRYSESTIVYILHVVK